MTYESHQFIEWLAEKGFKVDEWDEHYMEIIEALWARFAKLDGSEKGSPKLR